MAILSDQEDRAPNGDRVELLGPRPGGVIQPFVVVPAAPHEPGAGGQAAPAGPHPLQDPAAAGDALELEAQPSQSQVLQMDMRVVQTGPGCAGEIVHDGVPSGGRAGAVAHRQDASIRPGRHLGAAAPKDQSP